MGGIVGQTGIFQVAFSELASWPCEFREHVRVAGAGTWLAGMFTTTIHSQSRDHRLTSWRAPGTVGPKRGGADVSCEASQAGLRQVWFLWASWPRAFFTL